MISDDDMVRAAWIEKRLKNFNPVNGNWDSFLQIREMAIDEFDEWLASKKRTKTGQW